MPCMWEARAKCEWIHTQMDTQSRRPLLCYNSGHVIEETSTDKSMFGWENCKEIQWNNEQLVIGSQNRWEVSHIMAETEAVCCKQCDYFFFSLEWGSKLLYTWTTLLLTVLSWKHQTQISNVWQSQHDYYIIIPNINNTEVTPFY